MAKTLSIDNVRPTNLSVGNIKSGNMIVDVQKSMTIGIGGEMERFYPVTSNPGQPMGLLLALTYKDGFTVNSNITR